MAGKADIQYIHPYYTSGTAAKKVAVKAPKKKKPLPLFEPLMAAQPEEKIIVRLAEVLDTTPAFLMGWEEDKKEKPTADDGLSENTRALIQFAMSVPDEKAHLALRLLKSILEDD